MNAVRAEKPMSEEERMARVEADIVHLQKTVEDERQEAREFRKSVENFKQKMDDFKEKMDDFRVETANNFGRLREDMAKGFGAVAERFGAMNEKFGKECGDLRAEIERSRTWMVVTGASLVLTILGTAVALARYLKP